MPRGVKAGGRKKKVTRRFKPLRYRNSGGFVNITRKTPELYITNSATPGLANVVDTPGILSVGNPISTLLGTYNIPFSMKFKLSNLLNYTDITGLADQYKIKYIVIKVYFNSNTNSVGSGNSMPQLSYVVDHDDATAPPTVDSLREKMGTKIKYFASNKNFVVMRLQPRVAQAVFNTGVVSPTAYGIGTKPMWLNSAYPDAEHYAIKGVLQNVNLPSNSGGVQIGFKYDVTFHLSAKDFQ